MCDNEKHVSSRINRHIKFNDTSFNFIWRLVFVDYVSIIILTELLHKTCGKSKIFTKENCTKNCSSRDEKKIALTHIY